MNLLLVGIKTRPRYYMLSSISHATRLGAGSPPGAMTSVEREALRHRLYVSLFLLGPLGPLEEGSNGVHAFVLQYVHHPPVGQGPFHRAQPEGAWGVVPPGWSVHTLETVEHDRGLHLLPRHGVQHGLFQMPAHTEDEVEGVQALVRVLVTPGVHYRFAASPGHFRAPEQGPLPAVSVQAEAVGVARHEGQVPVRKLHAGPALHGPFRQAGGSLHMATRQPVGPAGGERREMDGHLQ